MKPFLLDKDRHHKLLLTSAGNCGVDSMAKSLHRKLGSLKEMSSTKNNTYIIRLHSKATEKAIFWADIEAARRKARESRSPEKAAQPTKDSSKKTGHPKGSLDTIASHSQTYGKGKYDGVDDHRVQNIELSLGFQMKKLAGLSRRKPQGKGHDTETSRPSTEIQDLYYRYGDGDDIEEQQMNRFIGLVEELMAKAISGATAICATVAGAVGSDVTQVYGEQAELIVVDEAARVPEYQWWPLLTSYPSAIGKIMVGDPNQLPPPVSKGEKQNPFLHQLSLSLQGRLQKEGFPSTFFSTQYRALPQIAEIYNNACYDGGFTSDQSTKLENRPLAQAIRRLNKEKYDAETNVVCFDVDCSEQRDANTKSRYCDASAHRVMVVLENLLAAKFKQKFSIAILTPYKAQHQRLHYAKTAMAERRYRAAAEVALETVDKIQGMEYDVVIIDPVVVRSPGFLDMNRLNVMFSRARCGLYVIGNCSA